MDTTPPLQDPDESRPAKRVRLDAPLEVTEDTREEMIDDGDWDDIYGDSPGRPSEELSDSTLGAAKERTENSAPVASDKPSSSIATKSGTAPIVEDEISSPAVEKSQVSPNLQISITQDVQAAHSAEEGLPEEALNHGNELVGPDRNSNGVDGSSARMNEEVSNVEHESFQHKDQSGTKTEAEGDFDGTQGEEAEVPQQGMEAENENTAEGLEPGLQDKGLPSEMKSKPIDDPDFVAAAAAQKGNANAEWKFDESDAESSSSDDSSDSDSDSSASDSGSDGGYEMLDPATAAKILMQGDGDDDGDGKRGGNKDASDFQPRTANEVKEEIVQKPQVEITGETKITFLGNVERAVENMALIKASTSGEYQVLESGSVLCNEKRQIIGAVGETLGRVQEPMYSIAFTNQKEIEELGIIHGAAVYYIDQHSTFVFTQPLKNLKGTDASNIHDEEVAEEEAEFSDDEKEAEYKRQKKLARRGAKNANAAPRGGYDSGRGGPKSFGAPGHDSGPAFINGGSDAPSEGYGGGMNYDDDGEDEFYKPLQRPDNLAQMMAGPPPPQPRRGSFERGKGRGRGDFRGRMRGDRGRGGRGGFHERNPRGGRGGQHGGNGRDQDRGPPGGIPKGPSNRFQGKPNDAARRDQQRQQSLPPKPPHQVKSQSPPQPQSQPQHSAWQQPSPQQQPYQQYPQFQQPTEQAPQTYQFNGYTFQYGVPQPSVQPSVPPQPQPQPQPQQQATWPGYQQPQQQQQQQQFPAGAYVNPSFWQHHQQQGGAPQPQPQQQQGNAQQQQAAWQAWYVAQAQQAAQGGQQAQANLAEVMRQLGGSQGPR